MHLNDKKIMQEQGEMNVIDLRLKSVDNSNLTIYYRIELTEGQTITLLGKADKIMVT